MPINGVRLNKESNCTCILIDALTAELKQVIRSQLSGIYTGLAHATEFPEIHSLSNTLKSFLDRYNSKDEKTRKGMIGELLAHIIINSYFEELTSLSVLKNKEDRSIKKGFDIIYYEPDNDILWYSEVKSGASESGEHSSTDYNSILLNRSKIGIQKIFFSRRRSLWESALVDVQLTINQNTDRINISNLLGEEIKVIDNNNKKHVILISVLYHDLADELEFDSLAQFYNSTINEDLFIDVLIISIQKTTFEAVADFLIEESNR